MHYHYTHRSSAPPEGPLGVFYPRLLSALTPVPLPNPDPSAENRLVKQKPKVHVCFYLSKSRISATLCSRLCSHRRPFVPKGRTLSFWFQSSRTLHMITTTTVQHFPSFPGQPGEFVVDKYSSSLTEHFSSPSFFQNTRLGQNTNKINRHYHHHLPLISDLRFFLS